MRRALLGDSGRTFRCLRLAAYYLSVLLVLSFIGCEVLDLDGSDFPVPSKSPRIKLAESQDLRRSTLTTVEPWSGVREAAVDHHTPLLKPDHVRASAPLRVAVMLGVRLALPRAAPDDPALSS
jgi:hypothetical protein